MGLAVWIYQYVKTHRPEPTTVSKTDNPRRLHCGCIGTCTCGDEEADDAKIREGIVEEEAKSNSSSGYYLNEIQKGLNSTWVIYDIQPKIDIAYKPIAEIKDMRKRIMDEVSNWYRLRDMIKGVAKQIIDNDIQDKVLKKLGDYTDNITLIAGRGCWKNR